MSAIAWRFCKYKLEDPRLKGFRPQDKKVLDEEVKKEQSGFNSKLRSPRLWYKDLN